jgi:hypothetical protein
MCHCDAHRILLGNVEYNNICTPLMRGHLVEIEPWKSLLEMHTVLQYRLKVRWEFILSRKSTPN